MHLCGYYRFLRDVRGYSRGLALRIVLVRISKMLNGVSDG